MNLFSWFWIISWISTCLLTQSLLKVAYATPQKADASASIQNNLLHHPFPIAAPLQPLTATPLTAAGSAVDRSLLDTVFPLAPLPFSSTPAAIAQGPVASPFSLAELINPAAQPAFDRLQTAPTPDYPASGPPHRLLQLVTSLSRWTKGISETLRLTVPLVQVVQINPPLNRDRWNMLAIADVEVPPAKVSDLPRQDCLGEDAQLFAPTLASLFQVQVRGKPIAEFPLQEQAERWADRLRQVIQLDNFDPKTLKPILLDGTPGGKAGDVPLFWVEPELAAQLDRSAELLAITWINNLRTALNVPALNLVDSQQKMHGLIATADRLQGTASWYGPYFHGRITATGETFDQNELTAAHPTLPFDTYLKVMNLETGKAVIVRINDRGPYFEDRSLDLSREAARCLNSEVSGVVPYEAVIMKRSSGAFDPASAEAIPAERLPEEPTATNAATNAAPAPTAELQTPAPPSSVTVPSSSETVNP